MTPNKAHAADAKKRHRNCLRNFSAPLFCAADAQRWTQDDKMMGLRKITDGNGDTQYPNKITPSGRLQASARPKI